MNDQQMNGIPAGHDSSDAPATSSNPLWLIAAAMALFFVVAAAVLATG